MNIKKISERVESMSDQERSTLMIYLLCWAEGSAEREYDENEQIFAGKFFHATVQGLCSTEVLRAGERAR